MATVNETNPLELLLSVHKKTKNYLQTIAQSVSAKSINPEQLDEIKHWFATSENQANQILTTTLFPALLEAMAGSDAICIKGMAANFVQSNKQLKQQWHNQVLPALEHSNDFNVVRWVQAYTENIELSDTEIIPMADRLLDANAFAELAQQCNSILI